MRVLTVPNWSFGRNRHLDRRFDEILEAADVAVHFLEGDVDHNRTVSAFSGEWDVVTAVLMELATEAFEVIDLNRHVGVHPRVGALDVCPFVPLGETVALDLLPRVEDFATMLAARFELPVFLYEKSERGHHESALPMLRKGGFGGMLLREEIGADFGPARAHPHLGATVMGVRDFLVAMNANLKGTANLALAKDLARQIRNLRQEGDPRFLGVRALGLPLASQDRAQVSLNVTLPDLTPLDPILVWVRIRASEGGTVVAENELIGVIREKDLPSATRLPIRPAQVVQGAQ
jgi:glutamate formiminotransferase